jgi:AhpD family alkylhydroperoxidase
MYDMKNLSKIKKLEENAPNAFETFFAFDKAALAPGTVPAKYKELVATTQCSYCIQVHVGRAREAGAGDAELAEIAAVAATIRAGGAIAHATHLF